MTTEMTTDDTAARIETVLEKSDDQLAEELPALLDAIEGQTEQLQIASRLSTQPATLPALLLGRRALRGRAR